MLLAIFLFPSSVRLSMGTRATPWLEELGPLLLFFSRGMDHAVGLFTFVCVLAWLPFLPSSFWEWVSRRKNALPFTLITRRSGTPTRVFFWRAMWRFERASGWPNSSTTSPTAGNAIVFTPSISTLAPRGWTTSRITYDALGGLRGTVDQIADI